MEDTNMQANEREADWNNDTFREAFAASKRDDKFRDAEEEMVALEYFKDGWKALAALSQPPAAPQPVICEDCGDACIAHNPGVCGNCYAMKYRDAQPPAVRAPESEEQWEARKAELRKEYPDIAGEYKVFGVSVLTDGGDLKDGEFSVHVSHLIAGWVGDGDLNLIHEAVWEEVENLDLPEAGVTPLIVYESGERQDVFWHRYFRIAKIAAPSPAEQKKEGAE